VLAKEREESKAERIVGGERYGDVEHQLKKARVVGMQAQAEKISIETIQTKLNSLTPMDGYLRPFYFRAS
jgi:hypothetical protein